MSSSKFQIKASVRLFGLLAKGVMTDQFGQNLILQIDSTNGKLGLQNELK